VIPVRAVESLEASLLAKSKITITGPRSRGIVLDAIKRGEDDNFDGSASPKTLILRLYEGLGGRARGRLTL
jgi:alpha-mannosidase